MDSAPTTKTSETDAVNSFGPEHSATHEAIDDFTLIEPRKFSKKAILVDDDAPLIDTTEALPLRSKKTKRLQKQQQKKLQRTTVRSETKSFLEFPSELLQDVFSYLRPSDIFRLQQLNRATHEFIQQNEQSIARDIIRRRYWTLARCLPLPTAVDQLDPAAQAALLSSNWQDRLNIHKRPYQHVKMFDPQKICTCMTCVLAWNNLCMILDLAHFQKHLSNRDPIPMIPRGHHPEWNRMLIDANASAVEMAMQSPLHYAGILETHLDTIVGTLTRQVRMGKRTVHPRKLYHLSEKDIISETDDFLERNGPPSYEFPWHRDNYYNLEAYVPNRKWSAELLKWQYAQPGKPHEGDLLWVVAWFGLDASSTGGTKLPNGGTTRTISLK